MKRILGFILLAASFAVGQISGIGSFGCLGVPVTGSSWNSGTAQNTTQIVYQGSASAITVVLDQTSTISAGAITFLGDYGDGTFVNIPAFAVINPITGGLLSNPYTLVASTNQQFFIPVTGIYRVQLKLSTAITGSATVTPFTTLWCGNVPSVADTVAATVDHTKTGGVTLGTPANYGTSPGAVAVESVNAFVTNVPHVVVDTAPSTAVTQSGTWNMRNLDGAGNALTTNSTTFSAKFGLDVNILGTLGTAFSTAGKVDVKAADGDVFVRQTTGSSLHTAVDSLPATPAGSNLIGEAVQAATATTTDSVLGCYLVSAASTNSTSCKGSAGNFYGFFMVNTTATLYYLRLYNSSSAPTCSSATGFIESIPIPASASGAGIVVTLPVGLGYSTGIGFCFTGGSSSTDNTNAATGVFGAVLYK